MNAEFLSDLARSPLPLRADASQSDYRFAMGAFGFRTPNPRFTDQMNLLLPKNLGYQVPVKAEVHL
jgi:hypothetical protein